MTQTPTSLRAEASDPTIEERHVAPATVVAPGSLQGGLSPAGLLGGIHTTGVPADFVGDVFSTEGRSPVSDAEDTSQ